MRITINTWYETLTYMAPYCNALLIDVDMALQAFLKFRVLIMNAKVLTFGPVGLLGPGYIGFNRSQGSL
jgi:hypothetical protein